MQKENNNEEQVEFPFDMFSLVIPFCGVNGNSGPVFKEIESVDSTT